MRRSTRARRITTWLYPFALATALGLFGAIRAFGQGDPGRRGDRTGAEGPYPRLPGAMTKAPDWIGSDAPFDVARFFAAVPRDRNAAPLYLDAFFEFSPDVAICFPEGPERDRRRRAAEERMGRYTELSKVLQQNAKAVPAESIDSVIRPHDTGFRKLVEAQRRDRCVFEIAYGPTATMAHVQAARQVARIAQLRVRRAVEQKDFEGAIRDVDAVPRLARDLRPRGLILNQLFASAIESVVCGDMVPTILAAPGLEVEHCDRLLKLLLNHEKNSVDGYAEGLRGEYLFGRWALRDQVRKQDLGGSNPSDALDRAVRSLNDYYRQLLNLDGVPYARRLAAIPGLRIARGDDIFSRMLPQVPPSVSSFAQSIGRVASVVRAAECMLLMRRWQWKHRGLPRALAVAVKEAGLSAIPVDPYDGQPMRVGVFEGQTVVYSVGKDGRDDGGRIDSKYDRLPGDLIYRVPEAESRP